MCGFVVDGDDVLVIIRDFFSPPLIVTIIGGGCGDDGKMVTSLVLSKRCRNGFVTVDVASICKILDAFVIAFFPFVLV